MSIIRYALDNALTVEDLVILKQPIVRLHGCIEDPVVKHYEVLTRVNNRLQSQYNVPNLDILIQELELYEGTGYLDELIFKNVVEWMSIRKRLDFSSNPLYNINVHPDTINYNTIDISKKIQRAIQYAGINYSQICFEITENTLLRNVDMVQSMMAELREMGCKVALDDFGRKMLNLSTLKILKPDYVKIDGSYVLNAKDSEFDRLAIKAIVSLSKVVGAETIAEHVETEVDYQTVKDLGVDYGQGWYFARPVSIKSKVSEDIFRKGLIACNH